MQSLLPLLVLVAFVGCHYPDAASTSSNVGNNPNEKLAKQESRFEKTAEIAKPAKVAKPDFALLPLLAELNPEVGQRELAKIEREIIEEPKYDTNEPLYALLVIGPQRNLQVWMVMDGFTLYADKNRDGKIDANSEKFEVARDNTSPTAFEKFTVSDGTVEYKVEVGLWDWDFGKAEYADASQSISVDSPDGMRFIAWGDHHCALKFQPSIKNAPVVYIGGPLQMGFEVRTPFDRAKDETYEISAAVGTFGVGEGSFSNLIYSCIPESLEPRVTVSIPSKTEGEPPTVIETTLDHRC